MAYLISCDTVKLVRSFDPVFTLIDSRNSMMIVMFFNKHKIVPKSTLDSPSSPIIDDNADTDWCPIKEILSRRIQNKKEMF